MFHFHRCHGLDLPLSLVSREVEMITRATLGLTPTDLVFTLPFVDAHRLSPPYQLRLGTQTQVNSESPSGSFRRSLGVRLSEAGAPHVSHPTGPWSSCSSKLIFPLPPWKPEKDGKGEVAWFPNTNNPNRAFSAVTLSLLCQPRAEGGRK